MVEEIRIGSPIFSPDGRRVAYVAEVGEQVVVVVVDGQEGKGYDGFPIGSPIMFDSSDRLHYLAFKGWELYLVEEKFE